MKYVLHTFLRIKHILLLFSLFVTITGNNRTVNSTVTLSVEINNLVTAWSQVITV